MSAPLVTASLRALAQQRLSDGGSIVNLRQLGGGCFVDVAFAQALRRAKALTELDLSGNFIDDAAVTLLISGLRTASLVRLNLSNNRISDRGASALATWMSTLPADQQTLRELRLDSNLIQEVGAKSILMAISRCPTLIEVRLDQNNAVAAATVAKIVAACDTNRGRLSKAVAPQVTPRQHPQQQAIAQPQNSVVSAAPAPVAASSVSPVAIKPVLKPSPTQSVAIAPKSSLKPSTPRLEQPDLPLKKSDPIEMARKAAMESSMQRRAEQDEALRKLAEAERARLISPTAASVAQVTSPAAASIPAAAPVSIASPAAAVPSLASPSAGADRAEAEARLRRRAAAAALSEARARQAGPAELAMLEKDLAAKEAQLQKLLEGDSGEADRVRAARAAEQARQLAEAEARIEAQRQKDAAEKEQQRKRQEQLEKERMRRMVEERESLMMRAPPQSAETARASRPAPVAEEYSAQPAKMLAAEPAAQHSTPDMFEPIGHQIDPDALMRCSVRIHNSTRNVSQSMGTVTTSTQLLPVPMYDTDWAGGWFERRDWQPDHSPTVLLHLDIHVALGAGSVQTATLEVSSPLLDRKRTAANEYHKASVAQRRLINSKKAALAAESASQLQQSKATHEAHENRLRRLEAEAAHVHVFVDGFNPLFFQCTERTKLFDQRKLLEGVQCEMPTPVMFLGMSVAPRSDSATRMNVDLPAHSGHGMWRRMSTDFVAGHSKDRQALQLQSATDKISSAIESVEQAKESKRVAEKERRLRFASLCDEWSRTGPADSTNDAEAETVLYDENNEDDLREDPIGRITLNVDSSARVNLHFHVEEPLWFGWLRPSRAYIANAAAEFIGYHLDHKAQMLTLKAAQQKMRQSLVDGFIRTQRLEAERQVLASAAAEQWIQLEWCWESTTAGPLVSYRDPLLPKPVEVYSHMSVIEMLPEHVVDELEEEPAPEVVEDATADAELPPPPSDEELPPPPTDLAPPVDEQLPSVAEIEEAVAAAEQTALEAQERVEQAQLEMEEAIATKKGRVAKREQLTQARAELAAAVALVEELQTALEATRAYYDAMPPPEASLPPPPADDSAMDSEAAPAPAAAPAPTAEQKQQAIAVRLNARALMVLAMNAVRPSPLKPFEFWNLPGAESRSAFSRPIAPLEPFSPALDNGTWLRLSWSVRDPNSGLYLYPTQQEAEQAYGLDIAPPPMPAEPNAEVQRRLTALESAERQVALLLREREMRVVSADKEVQRWLSKQRAVIDQEARLQADVDRSQLRRANHLAALESFSHQLLLEENTGAVFGSSGQRYLAYIRLNQVYLLPPNVDPAQIPAMIRSRVAAASIAGAAAGTGPDFCFSKVEVKRANSNKVVFYLEKGSAQSGGVTVSAPTARVLTGRNAVSVDGVDCVKYLALDAAAAEALLSFPQRLTEMEREATALEAPIAVATAALMRFKARPDNTEAADAAALQKARAAYDQAVAAANTVRPRREDAERARAAVVAEIRAEYQRQMNERAVEIDRRVQLRSQRVETSLRVLRQQQPGGAWIEELPGTHFTHSAEQDRASALANSLCSEWAAECDMALSVNTARRLVRASLPVDQRTSVHAMQSHWEQYQAEQKALQQQPSKPADDSDDEEARDQFPSSQPLDVSAMQLAHLEALVLTARARDGGQMTARGRRAVEMERELREAEASLPRLDAGEWLHVKDSAHPHYERRHVVMVDQTVFYAASEVVVTADDVTSAATVTHFTLSSVLSVSTAPYRAKNVAAFDVRVRDPDTQRIVQYTFMCGGDADRDRWADGITAHKRHMDRAVAWAAEHERTEAQREAERAAEAEAAQLALTQFQRHQLASDVKWTSIADMEAAERALPVVSMQLQYQFNEATFSTCYVRVFDFVLRFAPTPLDVDENGQLVCSSEPRGIPLMSIASASPHGFDESLDVAVQVSDQATEVFRCDSLAVRDEFLTNLRVYKQHLANSLAWAASHPEAIRNPLEQPAQLSVYGNVLMSVDGAAFVVSHTLISDGQLYLGEFDIRVDGDSIVSEGAIHSLPLSDVLVLDVDADGGDIRVVTNSEQRPLFCVLRTVDTVSRDSLCDQLKAHMEYVRQLTELQQQQLAQQLRQAEADAQQVVPANRDELEQEFAALPHVQGWLDSDFALDPQMVNQDIFAPCFALVQDLKLWVSNQAISFEHGKIVANGADVLFIDLADIASVLPAHVPERQHAFQILVKDDDEAEFMAYRFVCTSAEDASSWIDTLSAHRRYLTRMISAVVAEEDQRLSLERQEQEKRAAEDRAERIARGEIDEFDELPAAPEVPAPFDEKQLKRLKASVDLAQARVDEHQKKMADTVLVVPMQAREGGSLFTSPPKFMAAFRQNRVFLMPPDLPETAVLAATSGDSQQPAFCFARVEVKSNVKVNFIDTQEVPVLHRFLVSAAAIADLIVTHVQRFFADLQEAKTLEQALGVATSALKAAEQAMEVHARNLKFPPDAAKIAAHHARIAETRSKLNALGMAFVAIEDDVQSSWFSGSKPRMLAIALVQDRVCMLPADRFCNGDEKKGAFDQQAAIDAARDPSAILMPADTFVLSRVETKRGDRSLVSLIDAAGATRRFRLRDTSDDVIVKLATLLQQCVSLRVELQDLETAEVREPHKFAVEDMAARVLQFKEQGEVTSALLQTREAEVSRLQAAVAEHRVVSEALVHFLPAMAPVSSFFGMSMQSRVVTFRQNNVYFLPDDTPVESIHSLAASSQPDLRFARFEFKRVGGTKFALIGDDAKSTVYKFEAIDSIAAQATLEYMVQFYRAEQIRRTLGSELQAAERAVAEEKERLQTVVAQRALRRANSIISMSGEPPRLPTGDLVISENATTSVAVQEPPQSQATEPESSVQLQTSSSATALEVVTSETEIAQSTTVTDVNEIKSPTRLLKKKTTMSAAAAAFFGDSPDAAKLQRKKTKAVDVHPEGAVTDANPI